MSTLPPWRAYNNGTGKRIWFLMRERTEQPFDSVSFEDRYHFNRRGELIRYGSHAGAQRAADRMNAGERAR